IVDRKRKHAFEVIDTGRPEFLVGVDDGFGVGPRPETMPAREQTIADLLVVVNLTVEGDPDRFVFVGQRLFAAGAIDDRQAPVTEADIGIDEKAVAVWTAMPEGRSHRRERRPDCRIEGSTERCDTRDATHVSTPPATGTRDGTRPPCDPVKIRAPHAGALRLPSRAY